MHSFRIFLACALRDQCLPNSVIREALRWSTDEALLLYARANVASDAGIRASAASAEVDSIRVPTILSGGGARSGSVGTPTPASAGQVASTGPAQMADPSEEVVKRALGNAAVASQVQGEVVGGDNLPDVDSDLRTFAGIGENFARLDLSLDREARRPIDSALDEEDEEFGPAGAV